MSQIKSKYSPLFLGLVSFGILLLLSIIIVGVIFIYSISNLGYSLFYLILTSIIFIPFVSRQLETLQETKLYGYQNGKKLWSHEKIDSLLRNNTQIQNNSKDILKECKVSSFTGDTLEIFVHLHSNNEQEKEEVIKFIKTYIYEQTGFQVTKVHIRTTFSEYQ